MPAERPIRRGQLISPFGVGSIVDFPKDETLMAAGLDAWPLAASTCPPESLVTEERLQIRLGVTHFRLPPEHLERAPGVQNPNLSVPFIRFPRYHYCPRCGGMRRLNIFGSRARCDGQQGGVCAGMPEARRPRLIPIRIIAACGRGHITDFPFFEWAHARGTQPGEGHRLRYAAGASTATLSGIIIGCSCGASRSLAGAFDFDALRGGALLRHLGLACSADRPWLGEVDGEPGQCGEPLRVVQRGASNVYFPVTFSSIYLPLWAEAVDPRIIRILEDQRLWTLLTSGLIDGREIDPTRCDMLAKMRGVDAGKLRRAAQKKQDGTAELIPVDEEEYRRHEYDAFREARGGENTDLQIELRSGNDYALGIPAFIRQVGLVRRLRETRVLAGFTRLLPASGPNDDRVQSLGRHAHRQWLPAMVVNGEGIFIDFDEDALRRWASDSGIDRHLSGYLSAQSDRMRERGTEIRTITPKFVLLHTFAHLLIRQLANDCGYGSASIRERIYCDVSQGAPPMQGVLLYTASGDAEGTMGGLVRQGEPGRLEYTIARALHEARWCSADPICMESVGQGSDSGNLAACHGCALLPETSCEEGNRLLDRMTVVGRPGRPELGFFGALEVASDFLLRP